MALIAGLGGAARNGCVALRHDDFIIGVCEQERVTRVRGAGFNASGLPDEALDELLRQAGRCRRDIVTCAVSEPAACGSGMPVTTFDRSFAQACGAFLPSPFEAATIVVCDRHEPGVTLWHGRGKTVTPADWTWHGPGFADLLSECAEAAGFFGVGREQRLEALARLDPDHCDERVTPLFAVDDDSLRLAPNWQERVADLMRGGERERVRVAAALQARIADLLLQFLSRIPRAAGTAHLCVSGSLFANSSINSRIRRAPLFERVFIPVSPGSGAVAVGSAMQCVEPLRSSLSPFLGPAYSLEEIKAVLDNCKLNYQWVSPTDAVGLAVDDLRKGRLVGWFEGRMEWGPRALGSRSILANPFSEYVLDNLNHFLKKRDRWRGFALSGLAPAVGQHFDGPETSNYMECDYMPRDRATFRHVLPGPAAAVRVQTVDQQSPPRFRELLRAFGERAGIPILVNTSFNGFQEPIVCTPRDAIRVFFGTGIDTLVLDQFVIRK
ncbi:MAG TPA: carbamoyltransferase C-terminal domain-containing protein [Vicinamibacterales bacterium]|jgi:carbamoyltransferase